jgi:hypothetical protein
MGKGHNDAFPIVWYPVAESLYQDLVVPSNRSEIQTPQLPVAVFNATCLACWYLIWEPMLAASVVAITSKEESSGAASGGAIF